MKEILLKNKYSIIGIIIVTIVFHSLIGILSQNMIYLGIGYLFYITIIINMLLPIANDFINKQNGIGDYNTSKTSYNKHWENNNYNSRKSSYKKPWQYDIYSDKLDSLYYGYVNDQDVLKQVLKKEKNEKIRVHASWRLFYLNGIPQDGEKLYNYLRNDLGLDEVDASDLMYAGAQHGEEIQDEMKNYVKIVN